MAVVDLLTSSREAIGALGDERSVTGLDIIGAGDVVALPVGDRTEARRQTDESVAALVAAVDDHAREGTAYRPALDALAGLRELRADVDARTEPPGLDQVAAAEAIEARYTDVLSVLRDANDAVAQAVDDPGLRRGAELYATAVEQIELWPRLAAAVTRSAVTDGGLDEPTEVEEVSRMWGDATSARALVVELAAGTEYEDAADTLDADLERSGYLDAVETALSTGTVDVAALTAATQGPADQGWPAFIGRVERSLAG